MWIAKNSLTGETYGKKYNSIYDCQNYIAKELIILEYLCQRVCVIQRHLKNKHEFDEKMKKKYPDGYSIIQEMVEMIADFSDTFSEIFKSAFSKNHKNPLKEIAEDNYSSNNVIRCYYVEQNRFATGFDF